MIYTAPYEMCLMLADPLYETKRWLGSGTRNRRNRQKLWYIPSEFCLFRGTEKARNSVPRYSSVEKSVRKSVSNHFVEDKNTRNIVPNHSEEKKSLIVFPKIFDVVIIQLYARSRHFFKGTCIKSRSLPKIFNVVIIYLYVSSRHFFFQATCIKSRSLN
jgi:hypothetical protein